LCKCRSVPGRSSPVAVAIGGIFDLGLLCPVVELHVAVQRDEICGELGRFAVIEAKLRGESLEEVIARALQRYVISSLDE
jgi:hypothetical protein